MRRTRRQWIVNTGLAAALAAVVGAGVVISTSGNASGADASTLRTVAVRTGDVAVMPDHVALVWRFTRATLEHDASADRYRDDIERRWVRQAVVSLAFAILTSRMYPTVKYALGHGKACTRVVVGGTPVAFAPVAAAAHR